MNLIERNKELMKKFETMINTADAKLSENLAEELIDSNAPFYTPASLEPLYGDKGYLSVVHWMRKSFSDVQWHITDLVVDVDKVAVKWDLTGTHDGDLWESYQPIKNLCLCNEFLLF